MLPTVFDTLELMMSALVAETVESVKTMEVGPK